jgi:pSer/pThr/pTyr-binding forkhead associated (FHA) protein
MASVIIVSGPNQGDYYPLGVRTNVIGRSEALPIQILDPKASRKHLQIRYDKDNGSYLALDMGSKHGTLVNGIEIKEHPLQDNDYITIGETI